jgi:hypothetical protein
MHAVPGPLNNLRRHPALARATRQHAAGRTAGVPVVTAAELASAQSPTLAATLADTCSWTLG